MSALIFLISVVLMMAFDSDKLTGHKGVQKLSSVGNDVKEFQSFAHKMRLHTLGAQVRCDGAKAVFQ